VSEVIQHHQPVGDPQRVVVRERDDARAKANPLRSLRRRGDEDLRRRDDFASGRVVLTDPRFVEAQGVEVLDELEIALQCQRRVGARAVERGDEVSEPELRH
jgi:hypothetical protein